VRCISQERLVRKVGTLPASSLGEIEDWLRLFLGL
jgi:mRNA-degrading endonuclease toxin of MazEF toxin-antitoxin module